MANRRGFIPGAFLDVEATRADGSFDQALGAGEAVVLVSVDLTGPDTVAFDVTRSALSFRCPFAGVSPERMSPDSAWRAPVACSWGVSRSTRDRALLRCSEALPSTSIRSGSCTAVPLPTRRCPGCQLRGGVEAVAAVARGLNGISVVNLDLGAVVAVQDSVRVGAGWRRTEIGFDPGGDSLGSSGGESDIDAELSGLSVWLWLVF